MTWTAYVSVYEETHLPLLTFLKHFTWSFKFSTKIGTGQFEIFLSFEAILKRYVHREAVQLSVKLGALIMKFPGNTHEKWGNRNWFT